MSKKRKPLKKILKVIFFLWLIPVLIIALTTAIISFLLSYFKNTGIMLLPILHSVLIFSYYIYLYTREKINKPLLLTLLFFFYIATIFIYADSYDIELENEKDYFLYLGEKYELDKYDSLYFSGITITTLGYGDIVPQGIYRLLAVSEAMLGVIFLGITFSLITYNHNEKATKNK